MLHQTITHADPIEAAVEKANVWVAVATPIIKAYLALDDIDGDMGSAWLTANGNRKWSTPASYAENAIDDARRHVKGAREELYASIEGIREDFLCDHWFHEPDAPKDTSDEAAEAYDAACDLCGEANDRLKRETVSVEAAVRAIGRF